MATDVTKVKREDVRPIPEQWVPLIKRFMHVMTRAHVALFRMTEGRLGKNFLGRPVCLVEMTGRKTGQRRTIPLMYVPDGDEVILVASQGGMDRHPVWYYNLVADPHVTIIAEGKQRKMIARQADDAEKARRWLAAVKAYPDFDEYQARTNRDIPLLVCTPESA